MPKSVESKSSVSRLKLPDATKVVQGEFFKSGRTRQKILDAAVNCLADTGYAQTTTTTVAVRAGFTRQAMLYHFPTRLHLMEATVYYVMRVRLDTYVEAVKNLNSTDRAKVIDIVWDQLETNAFRAFCELLIASRTNDDLSKIFRPALAEYDRKRRLVALKILPKAVVDMPWFELHRDIVRFLSEGFAMQRGLSFHSSRREGDMKAFLKALITQREGTALLSAAQKSARGARAKKKKDG